MRYVPPRFTLWIVLAALLGLAACDFGKLLGTRFVDFPLGEAGVVEALPDTATLHSGRVRIDSIALPERSWVAREVSLDGVDFGLSSEAESPRDGVAKSGTIECTVLIDKYPVAAWAITVEEGAVREVSPSSTYIPGLEQRKDGQRRSRPAEIPFDQLQRMVDAFQELPESRRPALPEELTFSLYDFDDFPSEEDRREIFRGIHSGFADREFDLTLIVRTQGDLRGRLKIEEFGFKLFDSGQRLLGGTETGS